MRRLTFGILFAGLTTGLWAYSYHETILDVFARVLPKIILSNQPSELPLEQIRICILHETGDGLSAEYLSHRIETLYAKGIRGVEVTSFRQRYEEISLCRDATALMLMQTDEARLAEAAKFARSHHLFSAAYRPSALSHGIIFSLDIGSRVRPYINVAAAKESRVPIGSALLQISRIYRPESEQ